MSKSRRMLVVILFTLGAVPIVRGQPMPVPTPWSPTPGYPVPAPMYGPMPTMPPPPLPMGPAGLPYNPNQPVPAGYRVVSEPDRAMLAESYSLFAFSYGAAAGSALAANSKNSSGYLLIPFFGPWLTEGRRTHADCSKSCAGDRFIDVLIVLDGLVQLGAGAGLLKGYLMRTPKLVRRDIVMSVGPRPMSSGYGLAAHATF
jgi:hypothetical protein